MLKDFSLLIVGTLGYLFFIFVYILIINYLEKIDLSVHHYIIREKVEVQIKNYHFISNLFMAGLGVLLARKTLQGLYYMFFHLVFVENLIINQPTGVNKALNIVMIILNYYISSTHLFYLYEQIKKHKHYYKIYLRL